MARDLLALLRSRNCVGQLHNPEGPEAANRIEALEAEVERLSAQAMNEIKARNHWRGKAERLTAERAELQEVLAPFARAADWDWSKTVFGTADDAVFSYNNQTGESITLGDLRRALDVLERK